MSVPLATLQAARGIFSGTMEHLVQQTQSRFRGCAQVSTGVTGKMNGHRRVGQTEMQDSTGRLEKTVGEEMLWDYRYVFPRKAKLATLVDEDDAGTLGFDVAPTGAIGQQHRMAAARKIDRNFLLGISGTNWEGQEEDIKTVELPTTQIIAVDYVDSGSATNSGLTLAKLIAGKGRFGVNEVYGQDQKDIGARLCMAVSQSDLNFLLRNVQQVSNADYAAVKALVHGEVEDFMGIHFIRSEQVTRSAPSGSPQKVTNTLPMWVSTGVYIDFWYDLKTNIDVLATQSQAIQVYSRLKMGSARRDEKSVVLINTEVRYDETV